MQFVLHLFPAESSPSRHATFSVPGPSLLQKSRFTFHMLKPLYEEMPDRRNFQFIYYDNSLGTNSDHKPASAKLDGSLWRYTTF